jgi:molecular chaperone DnaK (HSP70)
MKEVGDKVSEDDRKKVEEALTKAKGVLDSDDAAAVKAAEEALIRLSRRLRASICSRFFLSSSA